MRLFVAIELPDEVRERLTTLEARLRATIARQGVRFVPPAKLHLTVRFLGAVEPEALPVLEEDLRSATLSLSPVRIATAGLGAFPGLRRPRVVWAGVRGEFEALDAAIRAATAGRREADDKPFQPHLTLARVNPGSPAVGRLLEPLAQEMREAAFGEWTAEHVALMESLPGSGDYARRALFPLGR